MKLTAISAQKNNHNRVNVDLDGKYSFSLDIDQLVDLRLKVGQAVSEEDLKKFKNESDFGKIYARTLKFCLIRPRSIREIRVYLSRKKISKKEDSGVVFSTVSEKTILRVIDRLVDRGYIDDKKFAVYWAENRMTNKGISRRKLTAELKNKGIDDSIIAEAINATNRNDVDELKKIIEKKRNKYDEERKFTRYLLGLGFDYNDIKESLRSS